MIPTTCFAAATAADFQWKRERASFGTSKLTQRALGKQVVG